MLIVSLATWLLLPAAVPPADDPGVPNEWMDEDTGRRVVRLSRREGGGASFYFHQNPFTAGGDQMVFAGPTPQGRRFFTVDLATLAVEPLGERSGGHEVVAPRRRELFFLDGDTVCATHLDTRRTREIARLPEGWRHGTGFSVNADETLLLGAYAEGIEPFYRQPRSVWFSAIFEARLPNHLYTINIETGQIQRFYSENTWLGHVQFSPADPDRLMFCHEGPWHLLQRIWLVNRDGSGLKAIHQRTVEGEIAGHEFWDPNGNRVWFDLRFPGPDGFYLAGADIETGEEIRYRLQPQQWSYHYNISPDGTLFCGDGGGEEGPARDGSGKWIWLYRRRGDQLDVEPLCRLAAHDYRRLEPNALFTPDGKWVVFRSNLHGDNQVYMVEVEHRSEPQP